MGHRRGGPLRDGASAGSPRMSARCSGHGSGRRLCPSPPTVATSFRASLSARSRAERGTQRPARLPVTDIALRLWPMWGTLTGGLVSADGWQKKDPRSRSTPDYDVAVVGASIAGCTAAILLGRAGRGSPCSSGKPTRRRTRRCARTSSSRVRRRRSSDSGWRSGLRPRVESATASDVWTRLWLDPSAAWRTATASRPMAMTFGARSSTR